MFKIKIKIWEFRSYYNTKKLASNNSFHARDITRQTARLWNDGIAKKKEALVETEW
jgi:hypothetical protein